MGVRLPRRRGPADRPRRLVVASRHARRGRTAWLRRRLRPVEADRDRADAGLAPPGRQVGDLVRLVPARLEPASGSGERTDPACRGPAARRPAEPGGPDGGGCGSGRGLRGGRAGERRDRRTDPDANGPAIPRCPASAFEIPPDGAIAYAYLAASAKFDHPYFQNDERFVFTDSAGRRMSVLSFGIRKKDD